MKILPFSLRPSAALSILGSFIFLSLGAARAQTPPTPLDLNNNNIPDVWALRYQAGSLSPAADTDGDGASNQSEGLAGTDPQSAGSVIRVSSIVRDIAGVNLTFPTVLGKRYRVQQNGSLTARSWADVGPLYSGTGGEVEATVPATGATTFFQVYVQDVDTDNDGVTDYEEILSGYNPSSPTSFATGGLNDKAALLASLNTSTVNSVSVQAADDIATEPSPADTGLFIITRVGKLTPVTVNFTVAGNAAEGSDYTAISRSVTFPFGVNTAAVTINPLASSVIESPESVILAIASGSDYVAPSATTQPAGLLIHDRSAPNGTGLTASYWNEVASGANAISESNGAKFDGLPVLTRTENDVWFVVTDSPGVPVNRNYFSGRWTGEVLPEFSQIYTFSIRAQSAARVWVNGKLLINAWPGSSNPAQLWGTIDLQAGVRVPIVIEFYSLLGNAIAELSWQSVNQAKQPIPTQRLFPAAPPRILSPLDAVLIRNSPSYTYQIVASGVPTSYAATNLPPGWTINPTTGLISGTPDTVGTWAVVLTASNNLGHGSEILTLKVLGTGNQITRDVWTGLNGVNLPSTLPSTSPNQTGFISNLEAPQNVGNAFFARIRGTLTAPTTGSYRFWITGDDAAELWISNDREEANSFRRARVARATPYREWTHANAGISDFLWLEAGEQYYIEVRHKEGSGSDHVSVGWLKPGEGGADPTAVTSPTEVVPSFVLSPYVAGDGGDRGTLLYTNLTPQSGVTTSASGNVLLRLSKDETQAVITVNYSNLTTPFHSMHLHNPNIPGTGNANVICDFSQVGDVSRQQDGTWLWTIKPKPPFSVADIVRHLKTPTAMGAVYFNVHSTANTGGEIRGDMKLLQGSQIFVAPPAGPASPADHTNANAAARFLTQATFGVSGRDLDADSTPDSIEEVQAAGSYGAWIDAQIALPPTLSYPFVFTNRDQLRPSLAPFIVDLMFRAWWKNSITAPDQLRQRVAFALSEIFVISGIGPLVNQGDGLSAYYDMLLHYSLGNPAYTPLAGAPPADGTFHNLLKAVTLHPAMGRYLDMLGNDKPNPTTGRIPNENYAREVLQLFSIGLYRMWPDGSLMLDSRGEPVPSYSQNEVIGFSHVFSGWGHNYSGAINSTEDKFFAPGNLRDPMREVPRRHFIGPKRILNNVVLQGLPAIDGVAIDPNASHSATQYGNPAYITLPGVELEAALQQISKHPNIGPFICHQLIQRLVTSTPSRGYIHRVVQKFNNNGSGVSGDMKAVIKAILLDGEARSSTPLTQQGYGKQREPVARVTAIARAFPEPPAISGTYSQSGTLITVSVSPALTSFSNGDLVYLNFSGASPSDADDAAYTILSPTTVGNVTTFTARPLATEPGTVNYSQSNNGASPASLVIHVADGHSFQPLSKVYLDFTSGSSGATQPPDGLFTVTRAYAIGAKQANYFTVPAPSALVGSYTQAAGSTTIALTTDLPHTLLLGQSIYIDFPSGDAPRGLFTVLTSTPTTLTVAGTDAPTIARTGRANLILAANAVTRAGAVVATHGGYSAIRTSGTVALTFSDWGLGGTNSQLGQTPMLSPTVFNFFQPDYSFPGQLAQAGLITPEFQLTSSTTVINQANFTSGGIFNDYNGVPGLSSFQSRQSNVVLDFRPWMGPGPGGLPWVHNDNLGAFVDKMNILLMAGQLPSTGTNIYNSNPRTIVNAKAVIVDHARSINSAKMTEGVNATSLSTVTVIAHGYSTGNSVAIAGVTASGFNNSTYTLTVTGPNTFTVPTGCTTITPTLSAAGATVAGRRKPITGLSGFSTVYVANHGLAKDQTTTISGVVGGMFSPSINGTHTVFNVGDSNSFIVPVTRLSDDGQNVDASSVSIQGYPDSIRKDRIKAIVHLMVTSPDFIIQK